MYYGEYLEKANIFVGFDRFAAFDYPLLNWGEEDIYFMVAPSSYLDNAQLRAILYDHMYTRRVPELEYKSGSDKTMNAIRKFYLQNREFTFGVGNLIEGTWTPKLNK
jgi:tuberculosinol/isotuberculosinol synthase